jgi:hypothetical protein
MSNYTKEELILKVETILIKKNSAYVVIGSAFDNSDILLKLILDFQIDIQFPDDGTAWLYAYAEREFDSVEYQAECVDKKTETIAEAVCDLVIRKYEYEHEQENH